MEIEKLDLSVRAYNAAKRFGINTVEEFAERIDEFCAHAPKLGEEAREVLKNTELPQAQPSSVIVETAEYTRAVSLHRRICANAQAAQESLWEVCRGLKEMHDSKLYKELGYQNFEEYTEKEVGIKRLQARKYVAIADLQNGQSTNHFETIGTEKLYLLAKLDEPQREEIQQTVNVEDVSVRDLKSKIDDLKKANDRLVSKVDEAEKRAADSRKSEESACGKLSVLRTDYEMQQQKTMQLEAKLNAEAARSEELERQIEELESRPIDVTIESADVKALKDAHDKNIEALNDQHKKKLEQLKTKYEKQMKEGIAAAEKKAQEPDISGVWDVLYENFDLTAEQLTDFLENNLGSSRTSVYLERLKKRVREINTTVNDLLCRKEK